MSGPERLPRGFLAVGANIGIKTRKPDAGLLFAEAPAKMAAVVTQNACRAPCANRTARMVERGGRVRALLAVSGNANALNAHAEADDQRIVEALAERLGTRPDNILTAFTGVVGYRVNTERLVHGMDKLLPELSSRPVGFADCVLTTDTVAKIAYREIFIYGQRIILHAVSKGSGMISPALATTLSFITTDAEIDQEAMQVSLRNAVACTMNQLTVDNEMSTNDQVIFLASGRANNRGITVGSEGQQQLEDALVDLLREVARSIAADGEGATRRLDVKVRGAAELETARALARSIAGSLLVKAAVFGADSNFAGRLVATVGAAASRLGAPLDLQRLRLTAQGLVWFEGGACQLDDPEHRRRVLTEPVVDIELALGQGEAEAEAYGCDLTYDYVKINADYSAITGSSDGRVAVNEQLQELGPAIKQKLLVQALRYIDRFRGIRAVVKLDAGMLDAAVEADFAEDVLLLQSVGLRPIVVHGGAAEITQQMVRLGQEARFVDGLRVTDADSMRTVEMVLTGSVNQRLVTAFNRTGGHAVGLSGKDGGLIRARPLTTEAALGQVGEVDRVDERLLDLLEQSGYLPVVSPVGLGEDGVSYNIDSDRVAGTLARQAGAKKLVFMGDRPGLMEGDRVISELTADQLKRRLERGQIPQIDRSRVMAALDALSGGVENVHLLDGRVRHNLISELFTDKGVGTLIRRS